MTSDWFTLGEGFFTRRDNVRSLAIVGTAVEVFLGDGRVINRTFMNTTEAANFVAWAMRMTEPNETSQENPPHVSS